MVRCKGQCVNGRRCKRSVLDKDYCCIHDPDIKCNLCDQDIKIKERITLPECGHKFCKYCITSSVFVNQWYTTFSTEDPLKCPECSVELEDDSWQKITNIMVDRGYLTRNIVYNTYLSHDLYLKLNVELGKRYTNYELEPARVRYNDGNRNWMRLIPMNTSSVDIVYFEALLNSSKIKNDSEKNYYVFLLGDSVIREKRFDIQKELTEYVFHPNRIKNIEELDEM
jgi:hypothetical protein